MSDQEYQLFGMQISFYTGKVRGYLRYKGIPFKETAPSVNVLRKTLLPRVGRAIVPALITPEDHCIQDSTCIIDYLEERYPEHSVYPVGARQKLAALMLEAYADEWLPMAALHYRWHYKRDNLYFIIGEFGHTMVPSFPRFLQYVIGAVPSLVFANLGKSYFGMSKDMCKVIERSYEGLLAELNTHFEIYPYLFGERPSIADYGFLGSFYGHFYRDPNPGKAMREQAPHVVKWVERMQFLKDAKYGDFLPDDEIPATLMPILKRMVREQFPIFEKTGKAIDKWMVKHPETTEFKRVIGKQEFTHGGVTSRRSTTPFPYWMFQRSLNFYNSLKDKSELDRFLEVINGKSIFANQAKTQLAYQNFKLVVDK